MKKQPRPEKSREQILAELKGNQEFKKKMKFIRTQFFPALILASKNVEDAQTTLYGFNSHIMESFLAKMKEITMKDLHLDEKLAKDSEMFKEYQELLHLFDDMNVFEAKDIIEGMRNEIALFQTEHWKNTSLADLKTKWLDELE